MRKLAARSLVSTLVLAALASIAGGTLLLLERAGMITLRRVPHVKIVSAYDVGILYVAFVNTETVGGALRVRFPEDRESPFKPAELHRIWIPARSILLRNYRASQWTSVRPEHPSLVDCENSSWPLKLAPRGGRATLEFSPDESFSPGLTYDLYVARQPGTSIAPSPGVKIKTARCKAPRGGWEATEIEWKSSTPLVLDVDASTPGPGFFSLHARRQGGLTSDLGTFESDMVWLYDPDMTVIDEREPAQGP